MYVHILITLYNMLPPSQCKSSSKQSVSSLGETYMEITEMSADELKDHKSGEQQRKQGVLKKPKNILLPPCELTTPIMQPKQLKGVRKAYYRHLSGPFPVKGMMELLEEDLIFIEENCKKFTFFDYQLLSQYILEGLLNILSRNQQLHKNGDKIQNFIEELIEKQEIPFECPIYGTFKTNEPQKYAQFVLLLKERCHFCFSRKYQFDSNIHSFTFNYFQPRKSKQPRKIGRPPKITTQLLQTEIQSKLKFVEKPLEEYSNYLIDHKKRKTQFFKQISTFYLMLRQHGCIDNCDFFYKPQEVPEEYFEQLLANLIQTMKKPSMKNHAKKTSKYTSTKEQQAQEILLLQISDFSEDEEEQSLT